jgi:formamidopyrimidine-DNA glycosylase
LPELPEVQTIINGLVTGDKHHPSVIGSHILGAQVFWEKSIQYPSAQIFVDQLLNQSIRGIDRRGKFIIMRLDRQHLLIHLRMSGDLFLRSKSEECLQHDRFFLILDIGFNLVFYDPRKFGRAWLLENVDDVVGELGPEPFDPDLDGQKFYDMLQSRRGYIKPLLLDQKFIAGVGNIYSDEALFLARLHPLTRADCIQPEIAKKLLFCIQDVLRAGIQNHGASIDWVYRGGEFQRLFQVYRRTGLPCNVCGKEIERIIVGQRGTHYCPNCQPSND